MFFLLHSLACIVCKTDGRVPACQKMSKLTLWKVEGSPPANAVRVLADMLGLELAVIDVDFANMEHKSEEILAINPLGTVPILKDGDFVLTDSHAQMKYLLAKYGRPEHRSLYPEDAEQQALVDQSLFLDASIIFIRFKVVALPTVFEGLRGPTERHLRDIEAGYGMVEAYLARGFAAGPHLTIADICLGSSVAASESVLKVDGKRFPRITAWLRKLHDIPEFHKYVSAVVDTLNAALPAFWAKNSE